MVAGEAGEEAAAAVGGLDQDSVSAHSSVSLISSVMSQGANHWPCCLKWEYCGVLLSQGVLQKSLLALGPCRLWKRSLEVQG